jgi:5'-nucleotidase
MKFLLTNDDGVDAAGLAALRRAAAPLGELIVVAPTTCYSGCGHQVTTGRSFRVLERGSGVFAVEGTPADCARVGLLRICPDADWILSGVNHGGNLGADVWYSGTVAAVREAALHGRPGIAVSHYRRRDMDFDWDRLAGWLTPLLADLVRRPHAPGLFWNVNFPHLRPTEEPPTVVDCPLDPAPLPLDFRTDGEHHQYNGDYHSRSRSAGSDVDVCFSGRVAVTPIRLF